MTSKRPYLIRAIYEWILDNDMTPHLWVNAAHPSASVPSEFVEDGRIVLNISPSAVQGLEIGNDLIRFSARFGGRPMALQFAPQAVIGLLSRENAEGMLFADEEEEPAQEDAPQTGQSRGKSPGDEEKPSSRPSLRVVK
jgi:stringent starvation protein B